MSAVIIIKNVFQFAKILSSAAAVEVVQWDETSLKNALDWADYCMEMFKHIKGQEYEAAVNNQLHQMTVLLEPVSSLTLTVDCLSRAKMLLIETLLSNSRLPEVSEKKLMNFVSATAEGRIALEEVQSTLNRSKLHMEVCRDLLGILGDVFPYTDVDDLWREHKAVCQAKALLKHLINDCYTGKPDRFQKYCHALCDKLSDTQEGHDILVWLFCEEKDGFSEEQKAKVEMIYAYFLSWMNQRLTGHALQCNYLLNVPYDATVRACSTSDEFFHIYLRILTEWADTYSPSVGAGGSLCWKSAFGHSLMELCLPFQSLLASSEILTKEKRAAVLSLITGKVKSTDFTVWQDLAKSLLHLLKKG